MREKTRRKFTDAQLSMLLSHAAAEPTGYNFEGVTLCGCLVDIATNTTAKFYTDRLGLLRRDEVDLRRTDPRLEDACRRRSIALFSWEAPKRHRPETILRACEEAGLA